MRWCLPLCLFVAAAGCSSPDPESQARCGDARLGAGEECDDGNSVDDDACTNACTQAACGDGILRTDLAEGVLGAEGCDDGNDFEGDGCLTTCVVATCGDGVLRTDLSVDDEGYGLR